MTQPPDRHGAPRMALWRLCLTGGLALILVSWLVIGVYQVAPNMDYTYISIGNRPATLVSAWRPWKSRTRALMIVGADFQVPDALIGTTMFDNYGIYLDGKAVRRWDRPYIILLGIDADGKPVLRDMPYDKRRLEWLNCDNPEADAAELRRLDDDCAMMEKPPTN